MRTTRTRRMSQPRVDDGRDLRRGVLHRGCRRGRLRRRVMRRVVMRVVLALRGVVVRVDPGVEHVGHDGLALHPLGPVLGQHPVDRGGDVVGRVVQRALVVLLDVLRGDDGIGLGTRVLFRAQIVRMSPRSIVVQGMTRRGPDRMTFANRRGCPEI